MTIFNSAGIRALLVFCLLFGAAILYGWAFFYRDPGSVFYDPAHAFIRTYSEYREAQAHAFIEDVDRNLSRIYTKAGPSPKLCATVLTVNREGAHYLLVCPPIGLDSVKMGGNVFRIRSEAFLRE